MERVWAGAEAPVVPVPEPDTRAGAVADDLVVCRCEEVRYQDLAEQASDWASAVPGVKKRSRACMGTCQGRVCESAVRKLGRDRSRQLFPAQRARSPLRPTRVGELVPADSVERE
ncbi:MAG: (2Fe-2S)-binding protein [Actinomycetia bacterium]|nr:(2Fe-2S)-binding protein [Actinomycetes bacterium]